jgi:polysaccharide biosynthesis/export protein
VAWARELRAPAWPLLPAGNRPLLEYWIELCVEWGIDSVRLLLGDGADAVEAYAGDGERWGIALEYGFLKDDRPAAEYLRRAPERWAGGLLFVGGALFPRRLTETPHAAAAGGAPRARRGDDGRVLCVLSGPGPALETFCARGEWPDEETASFEDLGLRIEPLRSLNDYYQLNMSLVRGEMARYLTPGYYAADGSHIGYNAILPASATVRAPLIIGNDCRLAPLANVGPEVVVGSRVVIDGPSDVIRSVVLDGTYIGRGVEIDGKIVAGRRLVDPESGAAADISDPWILAELGPVARLGDGLRFAGGWLAALALLLAQALPFLLLYSLLRRRGGRFSRAAALALLTACGTVRQGVYGERAPEGPFKRETKDAPSQAFHAAGFAKEREYASRDEVSNYSAQVDATYRLGPGDRFEFLVRGRRDISVQEVIVSPDGEIALPRVGILDVEGLTLAQATSNVTERLTRFYEDPEVTMVMRRYNNNKVYVLGRVANPGVVHFHGPGSLLEALSLAGGLPVDTTRSWLSRCMIVRGNDLILWIDLRELLENGNMALNARLRNGDVIYIPQSLDQVAYIMGQVSSPGVLQLRSAMTVLDALMYRGGLTEDATEGRIYLIRRTPDGKGAVEEIDVERMVARGDMRKNYVLKDGDIVYVPQTGISKFNYYLRQLIPSMDVVDFSINAAESFGLMQELRRELWGQEGFVDGN